jgi:hypothetical protein
MGVAAIRMTKPISDKALRPRFETCVSSRSALSSILKNARLRAEAGSASRVVVHLLCRWLRAKNGRPFAGRPMLNCTCELGGRGRRCNLANPRLCHRFPRRRHGSTSSQADAARPGRAIEGRFPERARSRVSGATALPSAVHAQAALRCASAAPGNRGTRCSTGDPSP